jgi:hypothetical protein
MVDGGRNAAKGFLYQYIRTLEALLEVAELGSVGAVHVEGRRPAAGEPRAESIDYELTDHAGCTLVAVQVKGRGPGGRLGSTDIFRTLSGLVRDREAPKYQVITNATLGDSAVALVTALREGADLGNLRRSIDKVLSSAGASRARSLLQDLSDRELELLRRAEVTVDRREDAEVHADLRTRLRLYRNDHRAGLGDESAGFMAGYLINEIFQRAADENRAEFTMAEFRSKLLVDGTTLRSAVRRRDWGVVVGAVPGWPDIHRGKDIERIADALPFKGEGVGVARCTLVGLSGIGKSSLAAAYVMDRADLYDAIYWVDAESDVTILFSFARVLAHLTGMREVLTDNPELLRARVHDALAQSAGRWLMVLDNCVPLRSVEPWIPRAGDGHVIVTSTDSAAPSQAGTKISIGPMAESEAVALVMRRLHVREDHSSRDHALITELADAMERWPLALELATAYIDAGGIGVGGIPQYLRTLRVRSLRNTHAVPQGYPRTLVEAIYLCLERVENQSRRPDDPAGVAATALWCAAYLSSRRIPAHLLVTAVLMDPETAGGFQDINPVYMNAVVCSTPEVVSILRSESLVNLEEPLPAEGLTDPGVPDAVISVNSVLQEILRDQTDADPGVPEHILGRLAYHIALWLGAAHRGSDYLRTLAFAGHAASVDEHATRLGADSDYIAFMRGNLAGVLRRQGDHVKATALLRAEIAQLDGRASDHCEDLCCQARIELAFMLAEEEPPAFAEVLDLLGNAYSILQVRAAVAPAWVTRAVVSVKAVLSGIIPAQWGLDGPLARDLAQLEAVVADLLTHLPTDTRTTAAQLLEQAEITFRSRDAKATIELCRRVLGQITSEEIANAEYNQFRHEAQRLIIEALIDSGEFATARQELPVFLAMTEPAELYVDVREQLVHNAGRALALKWLTSDKPTVTMTELLRLITASDVLEPIEAAFPGHTAARIQLLQAVNAIANSDEESASAHLEVALMDLTPSFGESIRDAGWTILANLTAAALVAAREGA